ncbi:hypothetical protein DFJ73DRAFT_795913, partial [Zopfochytrium polystomum]
MDATAAAAVTKSRVFTADLGTAVLPVPAPAGAAPVDEDKGKKNEKAEEEENVEEEEEDEEGRANREDPATFFLNECDPNLDKPVTVHLDFDECYSRKTPAAAPTSFVLPSRRAPMAAIVDSLQLALESVEFGDQQPCVVMLVRQSGCPSRKALLFDRPEAADGDDATTQFAESILRTVKLGADGDSDSQADEAAEDDDTAPTSEPEEGDEDAVKDKDASKVDLVGGNEDEPVASSPETAAEDKDAASPPETASEDKDDQADATDSAEQGLVESKPDQEEGGAASKPATGNDDGGDQENDEAEEDQDEAGEEEAGEEEAGEEDVSDEERDAKLLATVVGTDYEVELVEDDETKGEDTASAPSPSVFLSVERKDSGDLETRFLVCPVKKVAEEWWRRRLGKKEAEAEDRKKKLDEFEFEIQCGTTTKRFCFSDDDVNPEFDGRDYVIDTEWLGKKLFDCVKSNFEIDLTDSKRTFIKQLHEWCWGYQFKDFLFQDPSLAILSGEKFKLETYHPDLEHKKVPSSKQLCMFKVLQLDSLTPEYCEEVHKLAKNPEYDLHYIAAIKLSALNLSSTVVLVPEKLKSPRQYLKTLFQRHLGVQDFSAKLIKMQNTKRGSDPLYISADKETEMEEMEIPHENDALFDAEFYLYPNPNARASVEFEGTVNEFPLLEATKDFLYRTICILKWPDWNNYFSPETLENCDVFGVAGDKCLAITDDASVQTALEFAETSSGEKVLRVKVSAFTMVEHVEQKKVPIHGWTLTDLKKSIASVFGLPDGFAFDIGVRKLPRDEVDKIVGDINPMAVFDVLKEAEKDNRREEYGYFFDFDDDESDPFSRSEFGTRAWTSRIFQSYNPLLKVFPLAEVTDGSNTAIIRLSSFKLAEFKDNIHSQLASSRKRALFYKELDASHQIDSDEDLLRAVKSNCWQFHYQREVRRSEGCAFCTPDGCFTSRLKEAYLAQTCSECATEIHGAKIRLVRQLSEVKIVCHQCLPKVQYYPVSHVWGNVKMIPNCAGITILLSSEKLQTIPSMADFKHWVWMDCFSIDQASSVDQTEVLPEMYYIYQNGQATVLLLRPSILSHVNTVAKVFLEHGVEWNRHSRSTLVNAHIAMTDSWWFRIWTMQEAVLSKVFVSPDMERVELDRFLDFICLPCPDLPKKETVLWGYRMRTPTFIALYENRDPLSVCAGLREAREELDKQRPVTGLALMKMQASRQCSVENDKVAGLLGIVLCSFGPAGAAELSKAIPKKPTKLWTIAETHRLWYAILAACRARGDASFLETHVINMRAPPGFSLVCSPITDNDFFRTIPTPLDTCGSFDFIRDARMTDDNG